jgi:hypothetical protein
MNLELIRLLNNDIEAFLTGLAAKYPGHWKSAEELLAATAMSLWSIYAVNSGWLDEIEHLQRTNPRSATGIHVHWNPDTKTLTVRPAGDKPESN